MSALAVVLLETFSCLGLGAAALRTLKLDARMTRGEHWTLSFAIGFGVLGWLMFPLGVAGHVTPLSLTLLLTIGCAGTLFLPRPGRLSSVDFDVVGKILLAVGGAVLLFDLVEALAPPADADTLAYHFAVPKRFLEAGRIDFIPEPLVGAVPFLVQMTYVPALGLGGEPALTLWTMTSGWAAGTLLYVLCRRHLVGNWSLVVTILFLTTPAVIYGGGTGQVETRIAMFVMVAAWAVARALETGDTRYAALAGLGSGFFAAAKYTGLLFVAVAGAVIIFQRHRFRAGAVFAAAVAAAGFQWYAWNAIHTGDPVFPMLFQWLGRDDLAFWNDAHDLVFKNFYFAIENPLPRTVLWLLAFPFAVTLDFTGILDAGRVGFGPYVMLVLPFAILGTYWFRDRIRPGPLLAYASLALLFYVLWFFLGGSQRIRHLLPVLPLFLICVTVAAERFMADGVGRAPLLAAVVATIVLQMAGHGLFALNYFKFLAGGADREAFLLRNVNAYFSVPWINDNLGKADRLFFGERQLRYYLKVPNLFGTTLNMSGIDLRPEVADVLSLYKQLRKNGITHLLLPREATSVGSSYSRPLDLLDRIGCLKRLKRLEGRTVQSRTLPTLLSYDIALDVLRLEDEKCIR